MIIKPSQPKQLCRSSFVVRYYHEDRTHLGLDKQTPAGRESAEETNTDIRVVSVARLGGLHHRYDLALEPLI
jgi:hypothetical protein